MPGAFLELGLSRGMLCLHIFLQALQPFPIQGIPADDQKNDHAGNQGHRRDQGFDPGEGARWLGPHAEGGVVARQFQYIAQEQGLYGDGDAHHKSIDPVIHPLPAGTGVQFILVDHIRDHDLQQDHQSAEPDPEEYPGDDPPHQAVDKPIGDQGRPIEQYGGHIDLLGAVSIDKPGPQRGKDHGGYEYHPQHQGHLEAFRYLKDVFAVKGDAPLDQYECHLQEKRRRHIDHEGPVLERLGQRF